MQLATAALSGLAAVTIFSLPTAQAQRGGPGGPGGPGQADIEVVEQFDKDENGRLSTTERRAALEWMKNRSSGRGGFGGGPGGRRGGRGGTTTSEGPKVSPEDVQSFADNKLYDPTVLRTIFLTFEDDKWESELETFKPTDVEVPATMLVDGKSYPDVGVSFRGASSFFMIPTGGKRSLNISMDFADDKQRLYGVKTLNLLNCNGDASLMSSFLYHAIASKNVATPQVNFVKVVINGRSWGVYASVEQFNKDFLKRNYGSKKGARWKVSGSPNGDAGLRYMGEDLEDYKSRYDIKSKDDPKAWKDLVSLCKVLNETPAEDLEKALEPILDIDGTLWFLAIDVVSSNSDGYWTRASDYTIYQNKKGVFHILPHDMNEAFREGRGRGGPGGPGGRGFGPPGGGPPGFGPPGGGFGGPPGGFGGRPDSDRDGGNRNRRPPGDDGDEGPNFGPSPNNVQQEGDRRGFGGRGDERQRFEGRDQRGGRGQRGGRDDRGRDQRGGRDRGGSGFGGGRGGGGEGGIQLDPLVGIDSDRFPLRSKLLKNKNLRKRYLQFVREMAAEHLNWDNLGPQVAAARKLIDAEVKADTRKPTTYEAFLEATDPEKGSLREFCTKRAEFLLNCDAIKSLK